MGASVTGLNVIVGEFIGVDAIGIKPREGGGLDVEAAGGDSGE